MFIHARSIWNFSIAFFLNATKEHKKHFFHPPKKKYEPRFFSTIFSYHQQTQRNIPNITMQQNRLKSIYISLPRIFYISLYLVNNFVGEASEKAFLWLSSLASIIDRLELLWKLENAFSNSKAHCNQLNCSGGYFPSRFNYLIICFLFLQSQNAFLKCSTRPNADASDDWV